jgi:K+-transporting ATPase c subunit
MAISTNGYAYYNQQTYGPPAIPDQSYYQGSQNVGGYQGGQQYQSKEYYQGNPQTTSDYKINPQPTPTYQSGAQATLKQQQELQQQQSAQLQAQLQGQLEQQRQQRLLQQNRQTTRLQELDQMQQNE